MDLIGRLVRDAAADVVKVVRVRRRSSRLTGDGAFRAQVGSWRRAMSRRLAVARCPQRIGALHGGARRATKEGLL